VVTRMGCTHIVCRRTDLHCRSCNNFKTGPRLDHGWHGNIPHVRACRSFAPGGQRSPRIPGHGRHLIHIWSAQRRGVDVTAYAAVINAVIYSGTGFLLLHNKVFR
jgi:hypothetical protein